MAARNPDRPEAERPRRPMLVEVAAAILIIGSFTDAVISFEGMLAAGAAGESSIVQALSVAVAAIVLILGLLIRGGSAWLVTLNVVAISAFLELRSLSLTGIISAILDMIVVGILLRERWWFRWKPEDPALDPGAERA